MKNYVVTGDYKGKPVKLAAGNRPPFISATFSNVAISADNVTAYEVLSGVQRTSGKSAIGRAAAGAAVLGPIGLMAGAGAKKKGTYRIALSFKNGKNCVVEVDDDLYSTIMAQIINVSPCTVAPDNASNTPYVSNTGGSVADEIMKLKQLLDCGAITEKEFNAQKKKLMK